MAFLVDTVVFVAACVRNALAALQTVTDSWPVFHRHERHARWLRMLRVCWRNSKIFMAESRTRDVSCCRNCCLRIRTWALNTDSPAHARVVSHRPERNTTIEDNGAALEKPYSQRKDPVYFLKVAADLRALEPAWEFPRETRF
ncbi:hypothetical protein K432DRAFT_154555 [Lepidopterella palustris CBS 459.81]|uniref:Secreted protein n=1 Tax=Lepidopterella palustris CBS 459.81 TaxID=1314670 RepID=A0A8E2JIU7_9PEZI|nr:hypothetical protein K432DRAFT_154555 [Lepidopterella palustris CBS 459.81]